MIRLFLLIVSLFVLSSCGDSNQTQKPAEGSVAPANVAALEAPQAPQVDDVDPAEPVVSLEKDTDLGGHESAPADADNTKPEEKAAEPSSENSSSLENNVSSGVNPMLTGFNITLDDIVLGNREASVVMIEYFAPTCPHCVSFHKNIFPKIKELYIDSGKIAYVMREFITNQQDLDATILARCNGSTAKYLEFIDALFEQQNSWVMDKDYKKSLTAMGAIGGVTAEQYESCLQDEQKKNALMAKTVFISQQPKFVGTPSFFVNAVLHEAPYSLEKLSATIDAALNKEQNGEANAGKKTDQNATENQQTTEQNK